MLKVENFEKDSGSRTTRHMGPTTITPSSTIHPKDAPHPSPSLPFLVLAILLPKSFTLHSFLIKTQQNKPLLVLKPFNSKQPTSFLYHMEPTLGLLGGGGGGVGGGGGGTEVDSYQNEAEIELGLGLSLSGSGVKGKGFFGKIMTAKDLLPSGGGFAGTKRGAADFVGSPPDQVGIKGYSTSASAAGVSNPVVGWPPIKTYRMNNLVNQAKAANDDEDKRVGGNEKSNNSKKKINHGSNMNESTIKERGHLGFVKVNMDGLPIGRKVDLNAHVCYETLAQTLEDMFLRSPTNINSSRSNGEKQQATQRSKLLDGSSEFVLTYEDKEGDWMLVGDVPWGMFLSTVKRLRIMKTSEANGLAPRFQGGNERQKGKHI